MFFSSSNLVVSPLLSQPDMTDLWLIYVTIWSEAAFSYLSMPVMYLNWGNHICYSATLFCSFAFWYLCTVFYDVVLGDEERVMCLDPSYSSSDLLHFSLTCSSNTFVLGSALQCNSILFTSIECLLGEDLLPYFFSLRMMNGKCQTIPSDALYLLFTYVCEWW
jgi:hypothetical protein